MPLRLSALFFRILRYFFHSFVAAKQKKEMLPLMILSNHFETAPFELLFCFDAAGHIFTDFPYITQLHQFHFQRTPVFTGDL